MGIFKTYINPFDDFGAYTDFVDTTSDTDLRSFSSIVQNIDNEEFNVGVFNFNNFTVGFRNDHGRFSQATDVESIFRFKRSDSIFKINWRIGNPLIAGCFRVGIDSWVGEEVTLFKGLMVDDGSPTTVREEAVRFPVLGLESIFNRAEVPFGSISNGDLFSAAIYTCLNQTLITDLLTVDAGNITCGVDQTIDAKDDLENKTVKEALDELLLLSNSILYIKDDVVYVKDRSASASVSKIFYGPGSNDGIENIINIENIRTGQNRMFNLWRWADTAITSRDSSSISTYGLKVRSSDFSSSLITNSSKQQAILDSYKDEFKLPKMECELMTPLDYSTYNLFIKDKVTINHPLIGISSSGADIPSYGVSKYAESIYPIRKGVIEFTEDTEWKIMGREILTKEQLIVFKLREV